MVSVCLPSDALLQYLPSYLGFSYLVRGVSLHGCSSKAQLLFLTLDKGYLLTATVPDLQRGTAPLGPPVLRSHHSSGCSSRPQPWPRVWVAPPSCRPWPRAWHGSSGSPPLTLGARWLLLAAPILDAGCLLLAATGLGRGVAPLGCRP